MQSFAVDNWYRAREDETADDTLCGYHRSRRTTPSQKRMLEHTAHLQRHEGKSWFCWRDFQELNLTHGTIRNNLCKLKDMGVIELSHRSNDAYYTLQKDALKMTLDYLRVNHDDTVINNNNPQLASLIERLTYDAPAVHNIWLAFDCPTIYDTLLRLRGGARGAGAGAEGHHHDKKEIIVLPRSKNLVLQKREILEGGAIKAQITVSTRNNVTVCLACSNHPIHFDIAGLVILTSCLCRLEERLRSKLLNLIDIPYSGSWIVTMWHVGVDSKERYTGSPFEETWDHVTGEMYRIYSKVIEKRKNRVLRLERQEHPNNPVHDAVEQILSRVLGGASSSRGVV